jgi:hypothetical protein
MLSRKLIVLAAVVVLAGVILIALFVAPFAALKSADEKTKSAWSDFEAGYRERLALMPRLAAGVQQYAPRQITTATHFFEGYEKWNNMSIAEKATLINQFESSIPIAVNGINLSSGSSDPQFLKLQQDLADMEVPSQAANTYNAAAAEFNNALKSFPDYGKAYPYLRW